MIWLVDFLRGLKKTDLPSVHHRLQSSHRSQVAISEELVGMESQLLASQQKVEEAREAVIRAEAELVAREQELEAVHQALELRQKELADLIADQSSLEQILPQHHGLLLGSEDLHLILGGP